MKKTILIALLALGFTLISCSLLRSNDGDGPIGTDIGGQVNSWDPAPFINVKSGPAMIGLACSGGGSRAAYLTAAILREIRRSELGINLPNEFKKSGNLIDQIDLISAVSGGALSAAYFVTNLESLKSSAESPAWNDYSDKMALNYRQLEWTILGVLNLVAWYKTLFTKFNRGNIAREDYDNQLYKKKTLGDLPARPALYLNAFDVGNRNRFVFSRHFIDTDYYHEKNWGRKLHTPHDITSENDLVHSGIDPRSIRIADAVYASSAFPVVYPNLALNHFGGNHIAFKGKYLFLADGGLADNSGLATLLLQMKWEFEQSEMTRLVLGIYIDASIGSFGTGSIFEEQGIEEEYAWVDTYLGHGKASLEAAIDHHEDTVLKYLENTGVLIDDMVLNCELDLLKPIPVQDNIRASWGKSFASGRLVMRPLVIGLRLQDITASYHDLWGQLKNEESAEKRRLMLLFDAAQIPSGLLPEDPETGPMKTNEELEQRLSEIKTDFVLRGNDRKVLDLAAYILVHGKLAPALTTWSNVARNRVNPS